MSKAEQTKAYILEKIAPVFNKKGYAGTSLSDLEGATGLTRGSIYGNFGSKDEVAVAAFDFNLRKVNSIFKNELAKAATAVEKIRTYVRIYENFPKYSFPEGGCPILNTSTEADDTHPVLRQRAGDAIHSWKKSVSAIIRSGIEQGEFHKGTDPEQAAITLIAMLEGAVMIGGVTGQSRYRAAVLRSLEKIIGSW